MDKRRMVIALIIIIAIPLYIWIAYYEIPKKAEVGEGRLQQEPLKHDFTSALSFENAYMGDSSNSNGLFESLPLSEYKGTIAMDSDKHSMRVNYEVNASELNGTAEQAVLYNSTAAFVLIGNLKEIEMHFTDKSFTVKRFLVENWFGTEFNDLKDPAVFKEKVQNPIGAAGAEKWFEVYTGGKMN
ncbi:DUF4825 domain-containing protein [Sporosarcina oncorhynchi]|uniref:DUF4825 domain-containing protein n=1 Tax=Sporosarcina oncorhynchi TaxID=3056444 RepID=A0ABZ0L7N9_9BACL|nr:DUF4825 domain-containing protein [Sporosarcina sp. T2O-4]WOV88538.1 DUF4825 domain-containing protein [Sporosarcina sp. T2O-4]